MNSSKLSIPPLTLVSVSPRRQALLKSLGFSFEICVPKSQEITGNGKDVEEIVVANALQKAQSIEKGNSPENIRIGCDTVVVLGEKIFGKPADKTEARKILEQLSESSHLVVSGLALVSKKFGIRKRSVTTHIVFKKISPQWLEGYLETQEPYDKAGAYAIQGLGSLFVKSFQGSYSNIMGFPLEAFLEELENLTGIPAFRWAK